jgi:CRP-like cAMP-binding protein
MTPEHLLEALGPDLRRRTTERRVAAGESLFHRGDAPAFMFYVLSGEARLLRHAASGAQIVIQRAREGFLAEASLDQAAYHCDAIAAEPTRALAIPIAGLRAALAGETMRVFWLAHLGRALRRARANAERLALRGAGARIVHYVETEGEDGRLVLTQSKRSLAAELGLTHEALYRALRALREQGALSVEGDVLRLRPAGCASANSCREGTSADRRGFLHPTRRVAATGPDQE